MFDVFIQETKLTKKNIMTIEKSLQRIHWRVSKGDSYKPNENDIEAINFMVEWVNNQKEKTIQQNRLFAKIYAYALIQELEFYKDIEFASNNLCNVLSSPLELLYKKFQASFNRMKLNEFRRSVGLSEKHCLLINEEDTAKEDEIIRQHQDVFIKLMEGIDTDDQLNNQITECINKYKNHD